MSDPRTTHYALGELGGAEREAFEKELAASAELQNELKEAVALVEALHALPIADEGFSPEERAALRTECAANVKVMRRRFVFRRALAVGSLAAAAVLVVGFLVFTAPEKDNIALLHTEGAVALPSGKGISVSAAPAATPKALEAPVATASRLDNAPIPAEMSAAVPASEGEEVAFGSKSAQTVVSNILIADAGWSLPVRRFSAGAATVTEEKADLAPASPVTAGSRTASTASGAPFDGYDQYGSAIVTGNDVTTAPARIVEFTAQWEKREAKPGTFLEGDVPIAGGLFKDAESYDEVVENVFLPARDNPLSTFSIDVDTASYANVRRFLQDDQLPPTGAIRTEELINYFTYGYAKPEGNSPFSVNLEVSRAPWDAKRELVRIGLKGRELPESERGAANLVFLIDVSGSMDEPDKLPLLQKSLRGLVENLSPEDRVAIAVYAGSSGLVLPSTLGADKHRIIEALSKLKAGGSTNGGAGIRLAYETAREHFLKGGNNRVILCTDGDFNVGTTSQDELVKLIEKERASGIFLSVLGFGTGNLKDSTMEKLADKGNGNYAYIDSLSEGRKVLVDQMGATLFTIAKDVKIQVEFNPARVAGYRLIGYENRLMAKEDFNNDKKDAGEIGAGHTVTALYEIIPAGEPLPDQPSVDPLKYKKTEASEAAPAALTDSKDLLTVKLRYKAPDGDKSRLLEIPLQVESIPDFAEASEDFQFAAAVGAFGMKLRGSPAAGEMKWGDIQEIVRRTLGRDPGSYRAEFLTLVEKAARLNGEKE